MAQPSQTKTPAGGPGLGDSSSVTFGDAPSIRQDAAPAQGKNRHSAAVVAAIERYHNRLLAINSPLPAEQEASRNMLRDAVYDAAADAICYLESIRAFVSCDDRAGLQYCTSKFVLFAREIANGCRGLIGPDAGGVP
jgi:hypothetical protein